MKLKGCIVVHGNRDEDRGSVRSDCVAADMTEILILLYIGTCIGLSLSSADIKGEYTESGSINREVFVRPHRDYNRRKAKYGAYENMPTDY